MDMDGRGNAVAAAARAMADGICVELHADWQEEQRRITFMVERRCGRPGSGADAIRHLLDLADEAGLPVVIDVMRSTPALIRYYWGFGFRMTDGDEATERSELAQVERENEAFLARPGNGPEDLPVTFMWRDTPPARTMTDGQPAPA